jgi:hypothetical protein
MNFLKTLGSKIDYSIREVNSPHWSLTKLGMLVFLYPAITWVFIFDVYTNNKMDWMNTAIFICGIVTPRMLSQILAARFGYKTKDGEKLNDDNSIDASGMFDSSKQKKKDCNDENV